MFKNTNICSDVLRYVIIQSIITESWIKSLLYYYCRGLLDDTYFHEAVRKVTNEEIPYYAQIGQRPISSTSKESIQTTGRVSSPPKDEVVPGRTSPLKEEPVAGRTTPPKEDDGRVSSVSLPVSEAMSSVKDHRVSPPSSAGSQVSQKKVNKDSVNIREDFFQLFYWFQIFSAENCFPKIKNRSKMTILKEGVDGFSYSSLHSVILFSNQDNVWNMAYMIMIYSDPLLLGQPFCNKQVAL